MNTPAYEQIFSQFVEKVIVITVTSVMESGELRMVPSTPDAEVALDQLRDELLACCPNGLAKKAQAKWASDRIDYFMKQNFLQEVWYGNMGNGKTVALVKSAAVDAHGMEAALRRIHVSEVVDAIRSGAVVPADVLAEYPSEIASLKNRMPEFA
jgi:hypothetical protein